MLGAYEKALNTKDIEKIAVLTYYSFGNAYESGSGPYTFICQDGPADCVDNIYETCAQSHT